MSSLVLGPREVSMTINNVRSILQSFYRSHWVEPRRHFVLRMCILPAVKPRISFVFIYL